MRKSSLFIAVLFIAVSYCGHVLLAGENISLKDYIENKVVEKKLDNGITVLLMNRGFAPTLAMNISFRVGSVDEEYSTIGAAHILEHMLFKGTDKLGTKDFKKESEILNKIEALGETITRLKLEDKGNSRLPELEKELKELQKEHSAYTTGSPYSRIYSENGGVGFNAGTSRDTTGYYIQLPSDKLELWAKLESEKLKKPVFREYYRERDNIMEERLMRYDSNASGFLYEKFFAAAFIAHPYRHPTIGWKSNIENMSLKDIRKFFGKYYIPSRMTIVVVGRQDVNRTFDIIKKHFGTLEYRPEPGEVKTIEPGQDGERRVEVNFRSRPSLIIGWKKPTYPKREDYIFDVMSSSLSEGRTSYLYRTLVLEKKVAAGVDVWSGGPGARYENLFMIIARPAEGVTPERLESEIYKVLDEFRKTVSEETLQKVKNMTESSYIFMLDSNERIASNLAYYQSVFRNWRYMSTYLDNIKDVTIDDIRKTYDRYIVPSNRTVAILRDSRGEGK